MPKATKPTRTIRTAPPPGPDAGAAFAGAARAAAIDLDALVARVDRVLAQAPYWFPVRHHSPTIARHLGDCVRRRRPKAVFIEGPWEAQGMIEFLIDPKTRPPVAIFSSFRDDSTAADAETAAGPGAEAAVRLSAWYPM